MLSLISKHHTQISSRDIRLVCKVCIAFDFLTSGIRALGIQMMQLTLNCNYFFLPRGLSDITGFVIVKWCKVYSSEGYKDFEFFMIYLSLHGDEDCPICVSKPRTTDTQ